MLSIGLMSGTSMDGIDAGLLHTDGTATVLQDLGHISLSYHPDFKILLKAAEQAVKIYLGDVKQAKINFSHILEDYINTILQLTPEQKIKKYKNLLDCLDPASSISLDAIIMHSTYLHAQAVQQLLTKTNIQAHQITIIGYHGQTLYHSPATKTSIIVGDAQLLANIINIPVIADFRTNDILAGGQGAPFAPLYHQALAIKDQKIPVAVVNCGGIANITLIYNQDENQIVAFDAGPGNGLLDNFVRHRTQGKEHMDKDGHYGKQGRVHPEMITLLYQQSIIQNDISYFSKPPPKALDINDLRLIPELDKLSLEDGCATLAAFTADSIVTSLAHTTRPVPRLWVLCGGGWHNPLIYADLKNKLQAQYGQNITVVTADSIGWNGQAMEAHIFAYLAVRSLYNKPLSMPGTTGVPHPLSGGQRYSPAKQEII